METVASMMSWLRLLADLNKKMMEINLANIRKNIEIQKTTLLTEMNTVDLSMFTHMEQLST